MKHKLLPWLLAVLFIAVGSGLAAQQDSLDFPAPQYMLPFYDHFSANDLNVEAMGRGGADAALEGGLESAIRNPATLVSDKSGFYMEFTVKPPINEINASADQVYTSPLPFGIFGLSGRLCGSLQGAVSYNVPKSVVYDDFTVEIAQGAGIVTRYPSYYLHQITATLADRIGPVRIGLNLHSQLHQFRDVTVFQTFERIDKTWYVFRVQPGVFYRGDKVRLGAAFQFPAKRRMDIGYEMYEVTLPWKLNAGVTYEFLNNKLLAEAEWEQCSAMAAEFEDRLSLKAGLEKRIRNVTYRIGLASFPGVFEGAYRLPVRETTDAEQLLWWSSVDRGGLIEDTGQLYGTLGFTYHLKGGKLALGVMRDLLDNVPTTRVSMALGFDLEAFKGKKFLIFDK